MILLLDGLQDLLYSLHSNFHIISLHRKRESKVSRHLRMVQRPRREIDIPIEQKPIE